MVPLHVLEDVLWAHKTELAKSHMALLRYRSALEANGIEPPDEEGADFLQMLRDCRQVIQTAHDFVGKLGSSKELLESWR